ncbi:MAG: carbamoyltransferase HypF [Clostridia bacterium]|nr:carbamoyltransferase HypF [Clostridia bacterium]
MTKRIFITGIVQGVGFRPCCKKVADDMLLSGTVKNLGGDAEIVIKCDNRVSEEFLRRLVSLLPKEARFDSVDITDCEEFAGDGFSIIKSESDDRLLPEIIPDIATCNKCLTELENKSDRRCLHPFISCAACGPRYSIINKLPYDRENTLMAKFSLCDKCAAEYTSPADRRLHAQTVACKECGPKLFWRGNEASENPLSTAADTVKNGGVIAVKDIGGYHFVCLAKNGAAIEKLRNLKLRERKPFAVMFKDLEQVKEVLDVNNTEAELLCSAARPIVLIEKADEVFEEASMGSRFVGAMLPSNPVQYMLSSELGALIMTSGNISGEPIITDNDTMLNIFENSPYLDGVLYHDRDIITSLDDSIFYVLDGTPHIQRRGRGVAPASIRVDLGDKTIFAAGGDLKACLGFYKNGKAVLSQHFGDLEDEASAEVYKSSAEHISQLFGFKPEITVSDMHPAYYSSKLSKELYGMSCLQVQHHHAHIASVMAEHNLSEVLGFALDGTGYGENGEVWGGEALYCKGKNYSRIAHLKTVKMCGGDELSKNAAESLACYLTAGGQDIPDYIMPNEDAEIVKAAIKNNINCVNSSSCGRLFDAVCCLLGFGDYNYYEGQCAVALENAANVAIKKGIVASNLDLEYNKGELDTVKLVLDILRAKNLGADPHALALGFHTALADGLCKIAMAQNCRKIALSGGTFNNRVLTSILKEKLLARKFEVYMNEKVPSGDGGIALGQLFIAGKE